MSLPRLSRSEIRERARAERVLGACLGKLLGSAVEVRLTRNRRRLISFEREGGDRQVLRAHRSLAEADWPDLELIVAWINGEPGSTAAVRTLLTNLRDRSEDLALLAAGGGPGAGVPGHHHDLNALLRDLAAAYFPALPAVFIAWTGRPGRAALRRLGSWSPRERLIRVHRALDRPEVPWYFVAHVVHHELCHAAVLPTRTPTGRLRLHGPEFRRLERCFEHLDLALDWERRHAGLLLR